MKRFILVLVLSCSLLLLFTNVSYASSPSINWSKWTTFNYQGSTLDFLNQICDIYFGEEFVYLNWSTESTTQTAITNILNALENNTYKYMYYYISYSSNRYSFNIQWFNPSETSYRMTRVSYNNANVFTCTYERRTDGDTIKGDYSTPIVAKYLIDTNDSYINMIFYKSTDYLNVPPPQMSLKYISNKNILMTINVNGTNQSFIKANYNLNGWINIGYIQNYERYNELQGYFGIYSGQSNVDNANYYDVIANFQYNKSINNQYTNNLRVDYDNGFIYLNAAICSYNHGYSLYFTGDGIDTTEIKYYYFVPIDSTLSSGDINNDNPINLDFDFINSIEYISQYNSGNNQIIIDEIFKSGDNVFGLVYDDDNFDNWGFGDFVKSATTNFFNTISNYNNVSLDFGYLGTISSADFMRPQNNALFDIVSFFANSFLLLGCVSFFYKTILNISTLDIDKIVKDDEDLIIL